MATYWYILQAQSGFEDKVAQSIRDNSARDNLEQYIEEVVVPTEEIVEVKRGKKVNTKRKFFPGYVLIKMQLNDKLLHMIRTINKVSGFLGADRGNPIPVPESEVNRIFKQMEEGAEKPKHTISFNIGENVRIIDGPFESFVGLVEEVDEEKLKLKVSVSIFGRTTPVELEFAQVEKE